MVYLSSLSTLFRTAHQKLLLATLGNARLAKISLHNTSGPMKERYSETAGAVCTCVATERRYPATDKAIQLLVAQAEG